MAALFGVVGRVTPAELDEMGERLAHRGPIVRWREVADSVYLGRAASDARAFPECNGLTAVVDCSSSITASAPEAEVLQTFVRHGLQGLAQLQGPFALAAWDERSQRLVLARDFIGLKPLHYCVLPGGGIAFATEYKALLALAALPAEPDLNSLQYMQCYKRTPGVRTLLKHVQLVPPGAAIQLDANGATRADERMAPLAVAVRHASEPAVRDELARQFVEATRPLVQGHARIGISLSGGIDSMSVAYACRVCAPDAELVGFTAGSGPDDPEIRTAAIVMERLGGRHEPVVVKAQPLIDGLPEAVWSLESPVGRTETVQYLEVGRAARRNGFDWLMTGMGSDNLFAGMPKHKLLWLADLLPPLRKDLLEFYTLTQSGRAPHRPLARVMNRIYFGGAVPPVPRIAGADFEPDWSTFASPGPEFLNRCLASGANDNISRSLVRIERTLQAFGVDFVSPFFQRSFMDHAFSIPSHLKIRRGQEKYILRQAMQSLVSRDLLNIPKGISRIRHDAVFAETLEQLASRYLGPDRVRARGFFDRAAIEDMLRRVRHPGYHIEAAMRLWTAIVTEIWAEIFIDNRGRSPSAANSRAARVGATVFGSPVRHNSAAALACRQRTETFGH